MSTIGPVQLHNRKLTDGYTTPSKPTPNPTGGNPSTPGSWIGTGRKTAQKSPVTHGVDLTYDIYSDAMGTLNQSNKQRTQTYGAFDDMLGNYDYDEAALRAKFDAATKAEYAAKRLANEQAQADFADKLGDVTTSAMDINRANLANAVANGYSRGTLAAQQYGAMLGVQQESIADASKLVQEKRQLAYDEAAALAQNAINAEQTTQNRIKDAATLLSQIYGYDANAIGSALYGAISGAGNTFGVNKTVQADFRNQDMQRDINTANNVNDYNIAAMQNGTNVLDTILSNGGNVDVKALTDYIGSLGLVDSEGSPITVNGFTRNAGSSYGSGGYSNSGGSVGDNSDLYAQTLVENGQWTKAGHDMLKSMGTGTKLNAEQQNTLLAAFQNAGSNAEESNKILKAVQDGKIRFISGASGGFYLAVNPTAFAGSRSERSAKFKTEYGTAFDSMTPSTVNQLKSTFGYSAVTAYTGNGIAIGDIDQEQWNNILNNMENYTFRETTNLYGKSVLICTHKDFAQKKNNTLQNRERRNTYDPTTAGGMGSMR